jgi:hypothetical protein
MFDPTEMMIYTFAVPGGFTVPTHLQVENPVVLSGNVGPQVVGNPHGFSSNFMVTGVGVEPATGNVWCSFYPIGYTGRLAIDEGDFSASTWTFIATLRDYGDNSMLPGVSDWDLRGVGFDRNGFAWTLGLNSDRVFKLDPTTNARAASMPTGMSIGVGSHYTYSDFTGSTALSFTAPRGFWTYSFDFGFANSQVDAIYWEAFVPTGTTAGVRIRAIDEVGAPATDWLPAEAGPGVPEYFFYPIDAADHRIILADHGGPLVGSGFEVDVRLTTTDRDIRPIVHELRLEWQRP